MATKPTLLGISGSLRAGSFNTMILKTLAETIQDQATLEIFPLEGLPFYNGDLDTATPPDAVAALRARIGEADGVVIATPEYNYGLPGVLKNALDWASRPYGKATLTGKPVLTLSSSPAATGGVRAQVQLSETLAGIAARQVRRPQLVITFVNQKIADGRLTDAATLTALSQGISDLLRDIRVAATTVSIEA